MRLKLPPQLTKLVTMIFALTLIAISINLFYAPHEVAPGGATGIAILVQAAFNIPTAVTTLAVNALMLILAWWLLDKQTARRILAGSLLLPALLAIIPEQMVVKDRLLAVIAGSAIFALGVALNYRINASSGGTTVPPMIMQKYWRVKPAVGLLIVDMIVTLFNIPVAGFEAFILATFAIVLTSLTMSALETGWDRKKIVYIMSPLALPAIKQTLRDQTDHGLTVHHVTGGYSGKAQEMLMVVVEQSDFQSLVDRVQAVDPQAFILAAAAVEVHGGTLN
ncbi:YitT family protein [Lacticaseibacillus mingshuiensis]|uniref:YitT family protein n=1 Tax=Lacticaseibacillus mingshuiensis TaxID=2799574 RepID=UPI001951DAF1|nr:YitT family protein [Lacticaseibacillus mingshuiensis]